MELTYVHSIGINHFLCDSIVMDRCGNNFSRFVTLILSLLLVCTGLNAATQRTYLINSEVWKNTDMLCRLSGVLGPSTVSPVPESEIIRALDRIDQNRLSSAFLELYNNTRDEVENHRYQFRDGEFSLDGTIRFNLEGYIHSHDTVEEDFFIPYRDRASMFIGNAAADFSRFFYLEGQYDFRNCLVPVPIAEDSNPIYMDSYYNGDWLFFRSQYGNYYFVGNYIFGRNPGKRDRNFSFQQSVPFVAYASAGNDYFSFLFGRNRQSFGNGITGNLIIGDNFSYQDIARLSANSEYLSYTLSYTHFGTQYADYDRPNTNAIGTFGFNGWHSTRVIHRLDFNLFKRLRLSLNLGATFFTDSAFDPRMFNPLMIIHGYMNNKEAYHLVTATDSRPDESNNIMSLEFEFIPVNGLLITGQYVMDQAQAVNEKETDVPDAWGMLINARYTLPLNGSALEVYGEFVYTNPYLYLNYKEGNKESIQASSDNVRNYNYDHVLGYYISNNSEVSYTGYVWGPDSITADIGICYKKPSCYSISFDNLVRIKGERGINYAYLGKGPDDASSNIKNPDMKAKTPTGTAWISWVMTLGCDYKINSSLEFYGKLCNGLNWNYHNNRGEFKYKPETLIGLSWKIV